MIKLVRRIRRSLGNIRLLAPLRRKAGNFLIMPWEQNTIFGLALAEEYPRFQRGYDDEAVAVADVMMVKDYTMTKYDRCMVLHQTMKHIEKRELAGDIVECGVWRGGAAGIMALANLRYGKARRKIHLFDAWGDWPDPTAVDGPLFNQLKAGVLLKADSSTALAACRELLQDKIGYPAEQIAYHRGLFEHTFHDVRSDASPISILRLDADWYEGTKLCLETFYDRIVSGGAIVIDDYGYSVGCRRAVDEFMAQRGITEMLHFVDYSCRYFLKA